MFDYSVTQGPSLHNCELLEKRKGKFSPQKKFSGGGGGGLFDYSVTQGLSH